MDNIEKMARVPRHSTVDGGLSLYVDATRVSRVVDVEPVEDGTHSHIIMDDGEVVNSRVSADEVKLSLDVQRTVLGLGSEQSERWKVGELIESLARIPATYEESQVSLHVRASDILRVCDVYIEGESQVVKSHIIMANGDVVECYETADTVVKALKHHHVNG